MSEHSPSCASYNGGDFKIVVLGDDGVGKSSLTIMYVTEQFAKEVCSK